MPRVVYGVMAIHPTHEISVPDPRLTVTHAKPNACNQCHLDKSVNWAIASVRDLWPGRFGTTRTSGDAQFDVPEGPRALFAGDALQRAIAAEAMGAGRPSTIDPAWARAFLIEAFADDYPIVRFFAAGGLRGGDAGLARPDYLATPAARASSLEQWRRRVDAGTRSGVTKLVEWLRTRRVDVDIEVGE
jgi:hypothetical protein